MTVNELICALEREKRYGAGEYQVAVNAEGYKISLKRIYIHHDLELVVL